MDKKHAKINIGIASCLFEFNGRAPSEMRLIPAGKFKARDGRPYEVPSWNMTASNAAAVIAAARAQKDKLLIDYDHQTLYAEKTGQPAPAAAWFNQLEWREDGLYATGVEWTASASAAIEAKEYRYISPVLKYNKQTGDVTGLVMAALVNYPAIDGLTDLAAAKFNLTNSDEETMNPELLKLLGLKDDADDAAVLSAATALQTASTQVAALSAQVDSLKAKAPDPAKYVPVETMTALRDEVAALSTQIHAKESADLVNSALSDGRLLPAQKVWAESLDVAALKAYLVTAQPIAALKGTQTGGKAPTGEDIDALSADEIAICKATGIDAKDFKKTKGDK
jgi:phage I-like protein